MKKILPLVVALALVPLGANAGDTTYELLSAPHVKGVLRIQVGADGKSLEYRKGSRQGEEDLGAFKSLNEGMAFVVEDQFDLAFANFNPFLFTVSADSKLAADPNFTALSGFIDKAETVSGRVVNRPSGGGGGGSASFGLLPPMILGVGFDMGERQERPRFYAENDPSARYYDDRIPDMETATQSIDSALGQWRSSLQQQTAEGSSCKEVQEPPKRCYPDCTGPGGSCRESTDPSCAGNKSFHIPLFVIEKNLDSHIITAKTLKGWKTEATGAAGVQKAKDDIDETLEQLSANLKVLQGAHETIDQATTFIQKFAGDECSNERIALLARIVRIMQDLDAARTARSDLKREVTKLSKYLEPFTVPNSWRGPDFIFFKPESDFEHVRTVTLEVRKRVYGEDLEIEEGKPIQSSIRLRRYSKMVFEAGAALAYVDLDFPVYAVGTSTTGQMVVKRTKTDKSPIKGGLMLNMITRWGSDMPVYPGFQFGITQVDDYPGFFAGFVARFTRPRPLALSAGWLFTYYKDLDTLVVDGPVPDAAALQNDLKLKRAPTKFYFAAQYTF